MTTDYIVGWADQMYRTPENKTEGIYKIYQYWEDALDEFLSVLSNNPRKGRLLLISEKWENRSPFGDYPTTKIERIAQITENGEIIRSVS